MSLRCSATHLESFRLYLADAIEEQDVIDSVKGVLVQTPQMALGRALHSLLERPQLNLDGLYERSGFTFQKDAIESVLGKLDPRGVFEVRQERVLGQMREGDDLTLVAKCDHVAGLHIAEVKTKLEGVFDPERWMASYQWRVMMLTHQAVKLTYIGARLEEDAGEGPSFKLRDIDTMDLYPYPELERDVRELVREFCRWLRARQLEEFLRKSYPVKAIV